jgi:hypothetical protein
MPAVDEPTVRAWAAALAELRGLLSSAAFHTCFQGTEAVSWEGDVFTIAAPHRFAQEWIDVRYRDEAIEALRRVLGRAPELVVGLRHGASPQPPGGARRPADPAVIGTGIAPRHVWQAVLGELRRSMPAAQFGAWIENTTAVAADGGRFTIAAPNSFAKEWIETHARGEIEAALASVLGRRVELGVAVEWTGGATDRSPGAEESAEPTERSTEAVRSAPGRSRGSRAPGRERAGGASDRLNGRRDDRPARGPGGEAGEASAAGVRRRGTRPAAVPQAAAGPGRRGPRDRAPPDRPGGR